MRAIQICAIVGQCCQMSSPCFRCGKQRCSLSCLIILFSIAVMVVGVICLGFNSYKSKIANTDLPSAKCQDLCSNGYITYNSSTCCIGNDTTKCQAKDACRQAVLRELNDIFNASLVLSAIIITVIMGCIVKRYVQKHKKERMQLKVKKDKQNTIEPLIEARFSNLNINSSMLQSSQTCSICLNLIKKDEKLMKLGCKHNFHHLCMEKYLYSNSKCPICYQLIK